MSFRLVKIILSVMLSGILLQKTHAVEYTEINHKKIFAAKMKYYLTTDKVWIQSLYRQENIFNPKTRNVNEPSKIIQRDFYNQNELLFLFDHYKFIREKIENPISVTNKNLINSVEMSMIPRISLPGIYNMSYAKLNVLLEFNATFL